MSSLKLKHSGGNSVSIAAPSSNPAANRTINLNDNYAGDGSFVTANSSDKVGIGTASPSHKLHVVSSDTDTAFFKGRFVRVDGAASSDSPRVNFSLDGTDKTSLMCNRTDSSLNIETLTSAPIKLTTNSTERMHVTSSGFLKVKGNASSYQSTTGSYHELRADNDNQTLADMRNTSSTGYGIFLGIHHQSSSKYAFQVYDTANNSERLVIRTDGDLENANNSYGSISDVKLKENIVDAKSQWNDIKALKVRNFNFKTDKSKTKLLGLVAQEAETVCPSLVKSQPDLDSERKDLGTETKVLKYSILYMKAIKALQEAQARIETLETKVAALEAA